MRPLPPRLIAWLCLVLTLLTGLTPAQGLVLCVEDDGCISIEVKASAVECAGCSGHERGEQPADSVSDASSTPECPCVDYVVPSFPDEHFVASRLVHVQIGQCIPLAVELRIVQPVAAAADQRGPPPRVPREVQTLAHIRTVILRV